MVPLISGEADTWVQCTWITVAVAIGPTHFTLLNRTCCNLIDLHSKNQLLSLVMNARKEGVMLSMQNDVAVELSLLSFLVFLASQLNCHFFTFMSKQRHKKNVPYLCYSYSQSTCHHKNKTGFCTLSGRSYMYRDHCTASLVSKRYSPVAVLSSHVHNNSSH